MTGKDVDGPKITASMDASKLSNLMLQRCINDGVTRQEQVDLRRVVDTFLRDNSSSLTK